MFFIAFMLRPLVMLIRTTEVTARILADDIMLMYLGDDIQQLGLAFNLALNFLQDMGSKIAADKSFTFSSDAFFESVCDAVKTITVGMRSVRVAYRAFGEFTF